MFYGKDKKKRQLAFITLLAIAIHMFVGRFGWFSRYEIYIWIFSLLTITFLYAGRLQSSLYQCKNNSKLKDLGVVAVLALFTLNSGYRYIGTYILSPLGSRDIYQQQYQMHRFVTEYYNKPVAVNDLG